MKEYIDKIHVIGDSHSLFWGGNSTCHPDFTLPPPKNYNKKFIIHHLGPCLAYSMNKYDTTTKGREKFDRLIEDKEINNGDTIMCSFGEIDLRCHILKDKLCGMLNRINSSINSYMEFINYYRDHNQIKFIVLGPIATCKDNRNNNPRFPKVGDEIQRNLASLIYNQLLALECTRQNFFFFSYFDKMIDKNLRTNSNLIGDGCHLSSHIYNNLCNLFLANYEEFLNVKESNLHMKNINSKEKNKLNWISKLLKYFQTMEK